MRVVNDKEENTAPSELGFLAIATHAFLTSLGIATVGFAPLPMILAHIRLEDPWPKVTALLGAVLAVTFLEVPAVYVVLTFIFGLFVADTLSREIGLWRLLLLTTAMAFLLGGGAIAVQAQIDHMALIPYWHQLVDSLMQQIQSNVHVDKSFHWEMMRAVFLYEGPFLYLSAAMLSVWFSVGLASHLGWFPEGHPFSGSGLRQLRLPRIASLVFVLLFIATFGGVSFAEHVFGGFFRLAGCLMFIQGCILLSEALARRGLSSWIRTFIYSVAIFIGFYALMGVGVVGPWLYRKTQNLEETK